MPIRRIMLLLATLCLSLTCISAQPVPGGEETETGPRQMETRLIPFFRHWHVHPIEGSPPVREHLKAHFSSMFDISWPHGSFVRPLHSHCMLAVRNHPEAIRRIETYLQSKRFSVMQVEVRIDFLEYDLKDIDALARANRLSAESLLDLWEKEQASLLYSPRSTTFSGQETTIKGAEEFIYPTSFSIKPLASTNAAGIGVLSAAVEPAAFETREVGVILAVLPEIIAEGNLINLTLSPEIVHPPSWRDYGSVLHTSDGGNIELKMEMPFFHTQTLTTQVMVSDGTRVLVGGGMKNETGDKAVYAFVTARLLDQRGSPFKEETPDFRRIFPGRPAPGGIPPAPVKADMPDGLELRHFPLHRADQDSLERIHGERISLREFFSLYGNVAWPTGSDIHIDPAAQRLWAKNTPDHLQRIEQTIRNLRMMPSQLDIQVDYVEFETKDVEALARANQLSAESLLTLWHNEQATLRHSPRIVTQSGQEAIIKGVTEYIYPTTFSVRHIDTTSTTNRVAGTGLAEPRAFETREVGVILAVLPEITHAGSLINLTMTTDITHPPVWKNYGSIRHEPNGQKHALNMETPFFRFHSETTQVVVADGERVMLGGGMKNATGDKTVFVFVTARTIDTKGHPIARADATQE